MSDIDYEGVWVYVCVGGGSLCVYGWCGFMVFVSGCVGGVVFVGVWVVWVL